jgi:serine/threonine protein phosphatase 1
MKTFAVGDIHGMYGALVKVLEWVESASHSSCRVVFLGDYIDRGPQSREVIELLMAGPRREGDEWVCLKGNHEDMMLECHDGTAPWRWWVDNGGETALKSWGGSVPGDVLAWCRGLPLKFETEHHFYVHAGANPDYLLTRQRKNDMLWIREKFLNSSRDFGKHIVHGHTPSDAIERLPNRTNLDTGSCFGGELSVGMFDDDIPGSPLRVFGVMP